jgi:hypothetical protein
VPLDDWISDPIASERHERVITAPPERAIELALEMPADGDPIVSALVRVRGLKRRGGSNASTTDFFRANGFIELTRSSREVVLGMGAPAQIKSSERIRNAGEWRSWSRPGWIKAAMNFLAEPEGDGRTRLITETKVEATDESARRRFRVYWLVVGPFSALIRRRWLRQIARAAEAERANPGR